MESEQVIGHEQIEVSVEIHKRRHPSLVDEPNGASVEPDQTETGEEQLDEAWVKDESDQGRVSKAQRQAGRAGRRLPAQAPGGRERVNPSTVVHSGEAPKREGCLDHTDTQND